jgi:membrane-bound lytic murein transglycosylase B
MSVRLKIALVFSCLWMALSCQAQNYGDNPAALALVDELVQEEGFDREELIAVLAQAERQDKALKAMTRPAERSKPWYEYRAIFGDDKRLEKGLVFMAEHRETLERAESELGVPAEIIVAILGVETRYGKVTGGYRVIDALSSMAFDYPQELSNHVARSAFFTSELKNFFILTRDQGFDPLDLTGSYAGAMGWGQFMPSSYREYAIDFDGDDVIDIWNNPVDAIGSVANYFKRHGWRTAEPVVFTADAAADASPDLFVKGRKDLKPSRTVAEFAAAGVVAREKVDPEAMATAMKFELEDGYEYWLGMHNFYVITRYNHSAMYAMSVYQLSQRLAAGQIAEQMAE